MTDSKDIATTTATHFSPGWFFDALARQGYMERLTDGMESAVRLYYEDYTDADMLDPEFYAAMHAFGEYTDANVDDFIDTVELAIHNETGRDFASLHKEDE